MFANHTERSVERLFLLGINRDEYAGQKPFVFGRLAVRRARCAVLGRGASEFADFSTIVAWSSFGPVQQRWKVPATALT